MSDREMLEAAIAADFEDAAPHAAYADLLIEQGDPRGEYIQLQLASENRDQSSRLLREWEQRAAWLSQQYLSEWLGPLAPFLLGQPRPTIEPESPNIDYTFRRGWLTSVEVRDVRDAFTKVLARAREARMLQELTLRNTLLPNNRGPLGPLTSARFLDGIKAFTLGDAESYAPTAEGRLVADIVRRMPSLRCLDVRATNLAEYDLCRAQLPELRRLAVTELSGLGILLATLALNDSLTFLESLSLTVRRADQFNAEQTSRPLYRELELFLGAPQFARLTDLSLRGAPYGDIICLAIAQSEILQRIRRLDLRQNDISDDGAAALARCPDLTHLEHLDIGQNRLSEIGIDALLAIGVPVQYDQQWGEYPEMPPVDDEAI